jgi:DNA repair protein RadA/Sms
VALGELGLGGEIRQVPQAPRRLAEAARLGFDRALVPPSTPAVAGIEVVPVADLGAALAAGLRPVASPRAVA